MLRVHSLHASGMHVGRHLEVIENTGEARREDSVDFVKLSEIANTVNSLQLPLSGGNHAGARVAVAPSTFVLWVHRYAPNFENRVRWYQGFRATWRMDETYMTVVSQWKHLFRADHYIRLLLQRTCCRMIEGYSVKRSSARYPTLSFSQVLEPMPSILGTNIAAHHPARSSSTQRMQYFRSS